MKRTALFSAHESLGAKLIDFGGWEMPVQYTSITDEHLAVRNAAGIFDISHMGEVTVSGAGAADFLNGVLTNDIRKLDARPRPIHPDVQRARRRRLTTFTPTSFPTTFICSSSTPRASRRTSPGCRRRRRNSPGELKLTDASHNYSAVAVQGPRVKEFINAVIPGASVSAKRVNAVTDLKKNRNRRCSLLSTAACSSPAPATPARMDLKSSAPTKRSGTSGTRFWKPARRLASNRAASARATRCARRFAYPLYGHELDEETTPIEAGLGIFVSFDKGDFIGEQVLAAQNAGGVGKETGRLQNERRLRAAATAIRDFLRRQKNRASSPAARRVRRLASASAWGMCRRNLRRSARPSKSKSAARPTPATIVPKPIYRKA